jgi:hypothetical protein
METNNSLLNLSPSQLRKAADLKERIDSLNDQLAGILSGISVGSVAGPAASGGIGVGRGRGMSAAGRARIAAAARARWARIRGEKGGNAASSEAETAGAKPKRTMSPAARRKIAAAQKARWAKVKAAKG